MSYFPDFIVQGMIMTVTMMTQLLASITAECAMCHDTATLQFLVVDDDNRTFNICEACRDRILAAAPLVKVDPSPLWVRQGV